MDEREQDTLALRMAKREMMGQEDKKPNDRYDVRSRDCDATDALMSYGKLSNRTSGGASNFLARGYL